MESGVVAPNAVANEEQVINESDMLTKVVRDNFDELETYLREYEIDNVVRFVTCKGDKHFNNGYEPWKHSKERDMVPKLMWGSDLVEATDKPYISVARKGYQCQYGKKKHKHMGMKSTCKIGCPVMVDVVEVLRLQQPQVKVGLSKYSKTALSTIYRNTVKAFARDEISDTPLKWTREFHLTIGPLSTHNHTTGEGAAGVQKIDTLLVRRIQKLASAGLTSYDVVKDNLVHYVEEELFKGKKLPSRNNTRFYPKSRDIFNHMYREKEKTQKRAITQSELDEVTQALADLNEGVDYSQQQEYKQPRYTYTSNGYAPCPDEQEQNVNEVSTYSTVTTSNSPTSPKLGMVNQAIGKRSPQERFLALVRKLHKIASTIEDAQSLSKLSAALVNVIMEAKPMVPADQVAVLYQEEPRARLHPRRIRPYRKKGPAPRRQTHPDLNPLAPKPPDKKLLRQEAKRKAAEISQRKMRELALKRAEQTWLSADQIRMLTESATEKRKMVPITFAGSDIKYNIPLAEGEPLPKVIIVPNAKHAKQLQLPTTVCKETPSSQVKLAVDTPAQSDLGSTRKMAFVVKSNQQTLSSSKKTIKSEKLSPQIALPQGHTTQSMNNITTIGHDVSKYPSLLPKQVRGVSNSTIAVTSKITAEAKTSSVVTTNTLASPVTSPATTSASHAKLITSTGVKVVTLPASSRVTSNSKSPVVKPKSSSNQTLSATLDTLTNDNPSQEVLVVLNIPETT